MREKMSRRKTSRSKTRAAGLSSSEAGGGGVKRLKPQKKEGESGKKAKTTSSDFDDVELDVASPDELENISPKATSRRASRQLPRRNSRPRRASAVVLDLADDDEDERGRSKSSRRKSSSRSRPGYRRQTVTETVIKSVARSAATSLGRALVRGILGSLKKGF